MADSPIDVTTGSTRARERDLQEEKERHTEKEVPGVMTQTRVSAYTFAYMHHFNQRS